MFLWRMADLLIKEARYSEEMTHRSYVYFEDPPPYHQDEGLFCMVHNQAFSSRHPP